jgi:hypothetical protein
MQSFFLGTSKDSRCMLTLLWCRALNMFLLHAAVSSKAGVGGQDNQFYKHTSQYMHQMQIHAN